MRPLPSSRARLSGASPFRKARSFALFAAWVIRRQAAYEPPAPPPTTTTSNTPLAGNVGLLIRPPSIARSAAETQLQKRGAPAHPHAAPLHAASGNGG